jgi:hypothetical protein
MFPGPHVVTVTKDGFATNTTTVDVKKNDFYWLFISLQPLGGRPLITSNPREHRWLSMGQPWCDPLVIPV